jgi:hypothetical protein
LWSRAACAFQPVGQPNGASIGTFITNAGAVLLATAVVILIYGLFTAR